METRLSSSPKSNRSLMCEPRQPRTGTARWCGQRFSSLTASQTSESQRRKSSVQQRGPHSESLGAGSVASQHLALVRTTMQTFCRVSRRQATAFTATWRARTASGRPLARHLEACCPRRTRTSACPSSWQLASASRGPSQPTQWRVRTRAPRAPTARSASTSGTSLLMSGETSSSSSVSPRPRPRGRKSSATSAHGASPCSPTARRCPRPWPSPWSDRVV
mmetsp:Transcript_111631/g.326497  ORF Transcript_111631/g.326497 Transcript_111631/m.326497 type:complete len:220 (-) Transcript_111631:591-1250(-)